MPKQRFRFNINMGIIIGTLFVISGIPQIMKLIKRKSSSDISIGMYFVTFIALSLTIYQAINDGSMHIAISTLMSLITISYTLFLIKRYA